MLTLKRLIDLCVVLPALALLSPMICLLAILVRLNMGSPVLFSQIRLGYKCKAFTMYKFRTMNNSRDSKGNLLPDEKRLGRFGSFLRSTSLDELPELWNVVRGDMSLVGPRPLLDKYIDRYTPEQMRRHDVQQGVTGWVQINGRNSLTWEEKFILDVWYVDNWTLWLDLKILLMTIRKVLRREDISAEGYAVMPEFMGSPEEPVDGRGAL